MQTRSFHNIEHEAWSKRANEYNDLFAPVSAQAINDTLDSLGPLRGKHHLDIACGTGHLVAAALARGAISEGIDFARPMIEVAKATYPKARFQPADATRLPYKDGHFQAVTCTFGLSHMADPQAAVQEAYRVLQAGGLFAFTLWYGENDGNELFSIIQSALKKHAQVRQSLPPKWTQLRFADEQACRAITQQVGFALPSFKKLPTAYHMDSALEVIAVIDKLSVRTKMILDNQPSAVREQIEEAILCEAESRRVNGSLSLAFPAMLTVVQKPH